MTVVNPKSISGINSITTGSGSDNLLTIHTSDASNTERFRIDSTGTTKIVTGIVTTLTATTGIVTNFTANAVNIGIDTGVYGEDLVVTGNTRVTGITTFGDSDNPASMLNIDATSGLPAISIPDSIIHSGDTDTKIRFPAADTIAAETGGSERLRVSSDGKVGIGTNAPENNLTVTSSNDDAVLIKSTSTNQYHSARIHLQGGGSATDNVTAFVHGNNNSGGSESYFAIESKNSSQVYIKTLALYNHSTDAWDFNSGASGTNSLRIKSDGDISINDGNLIVANGHGIDFSATEGSGATASILDDYEEGTYTPAITAGGTTYTHPTNYDLRSSSSVTNTNSIAYVKIGSMVYLQFAMFWNSTDTIRYHISLPFTAKGSAYALCVTPASFLVDIDGDQLGTLGNGNNSTTFDTYRILKDTATGGHGNVPLTSSSEVYYQICYEAL